MNGYIWLADIVLVVHWLIALFLVGGLVAIWGGAGLGHQWVRNWIFRLTHLVAIVFVAATSLLGMSCPLTVLEDWLRRGTTGSQEGFIQRWIDRLLYYNLPAWVFTLAYVGFAFLVAIAWRQIPPERPDRG